jgi:hypothetical protein
MKTTLTIIILSIALGAIMVTGYDRQMKVNCITLQNQAVENSENPHYYVTKLDHDECKEVYGIEIDAPIK